MVFRNFYFLFISVLLSVNHLDGAKIPDFEAPYKSDSYQNTIKDEWTDLMKKRESESFLRKSCPSMRVNPGSMPKLYEMCTSLTKKLNMATPLIVALKRNYITSFASYCYLDFQNNAFATGLRSKDRTLSLICIGVDVIENLTDSELEMVIAHELQHINHNHIIKMLIGGFIISLLMSGFPAEALWTLVLKNVLSRACETEADLEAGVLTQRPLDLANALDKIALVNNYKYRITDCIEWLISSHPLTRTRRGYLEELDKEIKNKCNADVSARAA
jgi:hypothetical protein